jgi:CheY-like chemotaxis protein
MSESEQTVLVVDDESLNIDLIEAILSAECNVVSAANGGEALDFAAAENPDLILLDIMMPAMDGYEVCQRLKSDPLDQRHSRGLSHRAGQDRAGGQGPGDGRH